MQVKILLLLLLPFCFSCKDAKEEKSNTKNPVIKQQIAFDKLKWKTKKGSDYPHRDSMIEDLIGNKKIRELKKDKILDLLGEPTRIDNNYLFYRITQKRIVLWPLHTKTLVIKQSEDSTIEWIKIHE